MRRLLVLVSAIVFVDAMLFGTLIPLIPGYVDEFDLSKLQAGLLVGAFGGGALAGGIPGGVLAGRLGPRRAVVAGLVMLAAASVGFALAGTPVVLGIARFLQGVSSGLTWAGALAWLTVSAPRDRRGALLGMAFGVAVFGAILGPMVGAVAKLVSIRASFAAVGGVALVLAVAAWAHPAARAEEQYPGALGRALRDVGFGVGLWLNLLAAFFFGVLDVLVPLQLDAGDWGVIAIGAVFLAAGLLETGLNPVVGRISDRRGRLLPIRFALSASIVVAAALAFSGSPAIVALFTVLAAVSFGGFFTPGMALVSDRAEAAGLTQGLGFGVMNTAWAVGALTGPTFGGGLADAFGDATPYLLCSGLCVATLGLLTVRGAERLRTA
jgi:MFS family permease